MQLKWSFIVVLPKKFSFSYQTLPWFRQNWAAIVNTLQKLSLSLTHCFRSSSKAYYTPFSSLIFSIAYFGPLPSSSIFPHLTYCFIQFSSLLNSLNFSILVSVLRSKYLLNDLVSQSISISQKHNLIQPSMFYSTFLFGFPVQK